LIHSRPHEPTPSLPKGHLFLDAFLDLAGFGKIVPLMPFYAQRHGAGAFAVSTLLLRRATRARPGMVSC